VLLPLSKTTPIFSSHFEQKIFSPHLPPVEKLGRAIPFSPPLTKFLKEILFPPLFRFGISRARPVVAFSKILTNIVLLLHTSFAKIPPSLEGRSPPPSVIVEVAPLPPIYLYRNPPSPLLPEGGNIYSVFHSSQYLR